ncbi:MAG: hypothetical protein ACLQM6_08790 [Acidobacteriaceae bacterium]
MRTKTVLLVVALSLVCGTTRAETGRPQRKCPVVIDSIELSYNHQGGESKPQLRVEFVNHAGKKISNVTFGLSVLDASGNARPYPDDLTYRDGLEIRKTKTFIWKLDPESVDIHRSGETVVVKKVGFIDTPDWIDDGSESCAFTVDYHAR